jgi:hypothetical protein
MTTFQQPLWGYQLKMPDGWVHRQLQDTDGFASHAQALAPDYQGEKLGHVLVRGEWNPTRQPFEASWNQHITRLAVMLGAKKLGAAPWELPGGRGFEVEIQLPKKTKRRLWAGILENGPVLLHFMVSHWLEERAWFEPLASQLIASLRFQPQIAGLETDSAGLPLPPGYTAADPTEFLTDLQDPAAWQAYDGQANMGALQCFLTREAPAHGWEIQEYVPFPGSNNRGFARLQLVKDEQHLTVGVLPIGDKTPTGKLVIKQAA